MQACVCLPLLCPRARAQLQTVVLVNTQSTRQSWPQLLSAIMGAVIGALSGFRFAFRFAEAAVDGARPPTDVQAGNSRMRSSLGTLMLRASALFGRESGGRARGGSDVLNPVFGRHHAVAAGEAGRRAADVEMVVPLGGGGGGQSSTGGGGGGGASEQ